jgi:hypothetical protein
MSINSLESIEWTFNVNLASVQICNVCCKTSKALRPTQSLLRSLFNKIYTVPYDNNSMAYYKNIINIWTRYRNVRVKWNCARNPETIKWQIFPSIYDHTFPLLAWFSDLSVAIGIYSLACLYNLKANRNQFTKYFEVYMILKDDCTERPLLAIEVWSGNM